MSDIRELDALRRELNALKVREKAGRALPLTPVNAASPFSANNVVYLVPIGRTCTPLRLECAVDPLATNNGSNYWTISLILLTPAGATTVQGSVNTSALTAGQWAVLSLTSFVTSPWDSATYSAVYLSIAKTGTPGGLYMHPTLWVV